MNDADYAQCTTIALASLATGRAENTIRKHIRLGSIRAFRQWIEGERVVYKHLAPPAQGLRFALVYLPDVLALPIDQGGRPKKNNLNGRNNP